MLAQVVETSSGQSGVTTSFLLKVTNRVVPCGHVPMMTSLQQHLPVIISESRWKLQWYVWFFYDVERERWSRLISSTSLIFVFRTHGQLDHHRAEGSGWTALSLPPSGRATPARPQQCVSAAFSRGRDCAVRCASAACQVNILDTDSGLVLVTKLLFPVQPWSFSVCARSNCFIKPRIWLFNFRYLKGDGLSITETDLCHLNFMLSLVIGRPLYVMLLVKKVLFCSFGVHWTSLWNHLQLVYSSVLFCKCIRKLGKKCYLTVFICPLFIQGVPELNWISCQRNTGRRMIISSLW